MPTPHDTRLSPRGRSVIPETGAKYRPGGETCTEVAKPEHNGDTCTDCLTAIMNGNPNNRQQVAPPPPSARARIGGGWRRLRLRLVSRAGLNGIAAQCRGAWARVTLHHF